MHVHTRFGISAKYHVFGKLEPQKELIIPVVSSDHLAELSESRLTQSHLASPVC